MLLQVALEALAEIGLHSVREPFRKRPHPALAALGYAVLGGVAGIVGLWLARHSFVHGPWRLANLVVAPLLAGAAMAAIGAWRVRRGQGSVRLDRFLYGWIFAAALALVRFRFAPLGAAAMRQER